MEERGKAVEQAVQPEEEREAEVAEFAESTEEKQTPTREEILAISRRENKNGDEREAQNLLRATGLAYSVGLIVIGIIQIVNAIIDNEIPLELYMIYTAMTATMGLYCGIKTVKHRALFLACGAVCGVCSIIFTVMWILKLCGVAL